MDVTSHSCDITEGGASRTTNQSECVLSQPKANGTLPPHSTGAAPAPLSDRLDDSDISDDCLTDSSITADTCRLLPTQAASALRKHKGVETSSVSPPPICTPPSSTFAPLPPPPLPPAPPPLRTSTCNKHTCSLPHHHHHHHHTSTSQNRLSSTRSHASLKTDAAHIKEVAGDDCCIHCLLACLFCELLSMCSAVGECLACGLGGAGCCEATGGCCCCVEAAGDAACTEEACQAVLDCGILEECCGSSDCMEICLECCSICFPS